jgi:hypothetical protein
MIFSLPLNLTGKRGEYKSNLQKSKIDKDPIYTISYQDNSLH